MKRLAIGAVLLLGVAIAWVLLQAALSRPDRPTADDALTQLGPYRADMDLRAAFESLPPAGGEHTGLTLLNDNLHAWAARWRLLTETRESIDVSYFILREDVFGAAFLGLLLQKARQDVRVRLLLDAQGTSMAFTSTRGNDWLDTLANTKGIDVKLFRPLRNRYLQALAGLNPSAAVASEHDKIMVCDRARGMIGGRNISAEYFAHPADMPGAFRDVDVILHGRRAARGLTAAFEAQYESGWARRIQPERIDLASHAEELALAYRAMDAWLKGDTLDTRYVRRIESLELSWIDDLKKLPRSRGSRARTSASAPETTSETRLLDSRTRLSPDADVIARGVSRLIQSAREHVLIQSPYLVLSEEAVDTLVKTGQRGVAITLYTNSPISSDNAMSQAFFLEQWPELLARVPGLRLFVAGGTRTLHSKLMVFDDQVALVGTYNLDPISMGVNSEIMAAIWSQDFAHRLAAQARRHLARGAPLTYEYTIERDRHGRPVRDKSGRAIVSFGPADHTEPEQWRKVQTYWTVLRAADRLPGLSPLF